MNESERREIVAVVAMNVPRGTSGDDIEDSLYSQIANQLKLHRSIGVSITPDFCVVVYDIATYVGIRMSY